MVAYYNGLPIGVHLDLYASALVSGKIRIGYTEYNIRDTRNNAPASAADMLFTVTNGLLMFGGSRIEGFFSNPSINNAFFIITDKSVIFISTDPNASGYRTVQYHKSIWGTSNSYMTVNNVRYSYTPSLTGINFDSIIPPEDINVCFLSGTMITTQNGRQPVEDIKSGDMVAVNNSTGISFEPVMWVGSARCKVSPELPDDESGYPVRIQANAFEASVPDEDLLVTSEHCFLFDGCLIPIRMLVNGSTIRYEKKIQEYDYYHIATERHSILSANNAPAESHLDTGNSYKFAGNKEKKGCALDQKLKWADHAAAPLNTDRDFVKPVFERLVARAQNLGFEAGFAFSNSSLQLDIHLRSSCGRRIDPIRAQGETYVFDLRPGSDAYWLCSGAARPCDMIGPFLDDRRKLGVLVGDITIFNKNSMIQFQEHVKNPRLLGWHQSDAPSMRWTNGEAFLPIKLEGGLDPVILSMSVISTIDNII